MLDGQLDRLFGHGERMRLVLAVANDLGECRDTHREAAFGLGA